MCSSFLCFYNHIYLDTGTFGPKNVEYCKCNIVLLYVCSCIFIQFDVYKTKQDTTSQNIVVCIKCKLIVWTQIGKSLNDL